MLLKGALKSFYKQQSKLILFQSNVYLNLLFQESLPPRIPNPIFIVLMMDSKKGLDEYLNIFDESPLNELDFRYFEFLKRIEYPFHHLNALLFTWETTICYLWFFCEVEKYKLVPQKGFLSVCWRHDFTFGYIVKIRWSIPNFKD